MIEQLQQTVTIGDIRRICRTYYEKKKLRLSFREAMHIAKLECPKHLPICVPDHFLNPDELFDLIGGYVIASADRVKNIPASKEVNRSSDSRIYIRESSAFEQQRDLKVYIHIPYINDGVHVHDHFEGNFVYRGQAKVQFNQQEMMLRAGDFLLFAPHTPHNVQVEGDDIVFAINIRSSTFRDVFASFLKRENTLSAFLITSLNNPVYAGGIRFQTENAYVFQQHMQNLFLEEYINDVERNAYQISYLQLLLSEFIRRGCPHETIANQMTTAPKLDINRILDYMRIHFQTVTLEDLVQNFYYSKSFLSKFIREQTGVGYAQLLMQFKLERGQVLLQNTDYTVAEICQIIGYESVSHFSRTFKKTYGMSPKDYRLKNRGVDLSEG